MIGKATMSASVVKPQADAIHASDRSEVLEAANISSDYSLEEFVTHPIDDMEWVDGQVVEKTGMTVKHGVIQGRLNRYWGNHVMSSGQGGEPCTEAPCRTTKQVRRPDVAYISPELLAQFGQPATFPQSFPLIAEIASPTDYAEELFAKAKEYLESGCEEVWIVFPEAQWIFVLTQNQHLWFTADETVSTQAVLKGFSINVGELVS
jgi:Uma2 family endonuclease